MGNIYIIGYMASGKSTFGRALAQRTGRKFIDLDEELERRTGLTISELMRNIGETKFREMERDILRQVVHEENAVISCGGGTPCHYDNMEMMNASGTTVWLETSVERIVIRVKEAGDTRPLLSKVPEEELADYVRRHLEARLPYYEKAQIRFSGERLENEKEIEESVREFLLHNA